MFKNPQSVLITSGHLIAMDVPLFPSLYNMADTKSIHFRVFPPNRPGFGPVRCPWPRFLKLAVQRHSFGGHNR